MCNDKECLLDFPHLHREWIGRERMEELYCESAKDLIISDPFEETNLLLPR